MNGENRRTVWGYWKTVGMSFAMQEVVGYDVSGKFQKLNDASTVGVAGYTKQGVAQTDPTVLNSLYIGYLDLLNDMEYPVTRDHLYREDTIYFRSGLMVTNNKAVSIPGLPSITAFSIGPQGWVTVQICPPGASR